MKSNQREDELEKNGNLLKKSFVVNEIGGEAVRKAVNRNSNKLDNLRLNQLENRVRLTSTVEYCAIANESLFDDNNMILANRKSTPNKKKNSFTQTMYNITSSMQFKSNRRLASIAQKRPRTSASFVYARLIQSSVLVVIALVLCSCIFIVQTQASSPVSSGDSPALQPPSQASQIDGQQNTNERLDALAGSEPPSGAPASPLTSSSSPNSATSIVASLSSAVASAAAAAAVAAAQSTLSNSDARSLLSSSASSAGGSANNHHAHHPRSPSLNLALKLADAIPEVPFSILHNMKKLDHAAPFYNVPNKVVNAGSSKESSHGLLASALSASGGFGGAADQLSALFRSPLWKRISDSYGEFTSEFRSLFRAPPTTMKGPSSSTTKLLRDISVPAFLMLLASTIPSDWRPVKTRRKSLAPADLSSAVAAFDPMTASASAELPTFSLPPQPLRPNFNPTQQQQQVMRSFNPLTQSPSYNHLEHSASNQVPRVGDINLQASEANGNWMMPPVSGQNQFESPLQQPIKRIGDSTAMLSSATGNDHKYQRDSKPVKSEQNFDSSVSPRNQPTSLFGSLTSSVGQSKLMSRIMNANSNANQQAVGNHRMMMNLADSQKMSLVKSRHQLSDKQRYSLVGLDDSELAQLGNMNEKLSPSSKPFLLSAMTHAITSMFTSPHESGSSGSVQDKLALGVSSDKTLSRRQQTQTGNGVEQRDLSMLLPQSWKEVVKRTMNNVKQEASTQWRSIEGQLANWVQDKLKTASSSSTASSASPNIFASVSSTALNILGIGNKNATIHSSSSTKNESGVENESNSSQKNKHDAPKASPKGALAGVANIIVNSLTGNRQAPSVSSSKQSTGDDISPVSAVSQYPTLTGAQPQSSAASMASGTASTNTALSATANA